MSTQELLNEVHILTQRNITLKEEIAYYKEQDRLQNFKYVQNLLQNLQDNTFINGFCDGPIKITISDDHPYGTKKAFTVDTLSPEFLTALTNELKNSLTKKAVELNDLLLQTVKCEPIPDLDAEWLNSFTDTSSEVYTQKDYVFKVGDKVNITSCGKQYARTEEYYNNWVYGMSEMVNDEINYIITGISKVGIQLNNNYYFPAQSLTLVEPAE
jgi:hypothetical protein